MKNNELSHLSLMLLTR